MLTLDVSSSVNNFTQNFLKIFATSELRCHLTCECEHFKNVSNTCEVFLHYTKM